MYKHIQIQPPRYASRAVYKDRAPTQQQLQRLIELADLREKCIILILALSGIRESTLCKLQYRHIKEDLENNVIPVHIHVEPEITKGKYADYDTFLGKEAVEYLHMYLEERRNGYLRGKVPPETITDTSPLIRSRYTFKPLDKNRISTLVHSLYLKANLIEPHSQRRYAYRAHSIRKFFKTQLEALGVNSDYIEYMMGHKISTYHDVQSKGVEFLRAVYASSGLSIRPKPTPTKSDMMKLLKDIIRSKGENPSDYLKPEAELHRIVATGEQKEMTELRQDLIRFIRTEVMRS